MRRLVHVITPGDHYSPSTGSAVPTVVHGLSRAPRAGQPRPAVAVARGTYADRYDSADIIEYDAARPLTLPRPLTERQIDGALSLVGLPRWSARRSLAATLAGQGDWPSSVVLMHNAPQGVPVVNVNRHAAVLYAHNQLFATYRRREADRVLSRAAAIICVSQSLADQTAARLTPRRRGLIKVVRNGVDAAGFARSTPLERDGALKVVFVGRMIPTKGADVLVEAVRSLGRPDVHLTLIGSSGFSATDPLTEYERGVRSAAATVPDGVTIRPFIPRAEVVEVLQHADVVVVPSVWPDPCPLTVLEGMAAGAALVASDIGGIPESVAGAGILVRPGDPVDLAAALESLADDEDLLRKTAAAGEAFAREHDWAWANDRLTAALMDVL